MMGRLLHPLALGSVGAEDADVEDGTEVGELTVVQRKR